MAEGDEDGLPPQRRRRVGRKRTIAIKHLTKRKLELGWLDAGGEVSAADADDYDDRPRTWGDCVDAGLGTAACKCPWISCKYNLYLDVDPETGSIIVNFPDLEPWEMTHTCALRVAHRGGLTLDDVGEVMNLTRERIRQIEIRATVRKLYPRAVAAGLGNGDEDATPPDDDNDCTDE